ncbi:hypothetical protein K3495_g14407 [Podosphaera aphanis]|nr:hypothetical protein K3495_g14407 [Podosphaera aphanis]
MLETTSSPTGAENKRSRRDKSHPVMCNSTMAEQLPEVDLISKVAIKTTARKDRAFRIPGEVLLSRNGKPGRIYLDNSMVCADQGSDLVLISPQLVRVLELEKHTLSSPQNQVITMGTADGSMVMLYDGKSAKKQLHPSYRGPFIVSGKGGSHGKSYTLKQINGTPIPGTFYGDHLKPFVPRIGHLVTGNEEEIALHQNIRAKKGFHKLPQRLRVDHITVDGMERKFE